ncbi:MAG: alpha/beta hydrolase [Alphaproteobacteria bacterium]|nr:MAG: alpha/beta hydrolase [Alphaproteobacteria bacterium]
MRPPLEERLTFVETPDNPTPPGGRVLWYTGHGGVRLRAGLWAAPEKDAAGTVFLMPGKSEYIEKYFEVIHELQERGFGVVAVDWRGQGLSHRDIDHPLKAHIVRFETFLDDFEALYKEVDADFPQPHVVLAHSMGGNIALRLASERDLPIKGLALSAPMTGIRLGRTQRSLLSGLGAFFHKIGKAEDYVQGGEHYDPLATTFEQSKVTQDKRRFKRAQNILNAHPPIAQGSATYGWIVEAIRSTRKLFKRHFAERIKIPVLLGLARGDQLVDIATTEALAARLPRCQLEEFPGAEHELLMERDEVRNRFWAAFDRFIGAHVNKGV